jgi:hypothetical protein
LYASALLPNDTPFTRLLRTLVFRCLRHGDVSVGTIEESKSGTTAETANHAKACEPSGLA